MVALLLTALMRPRHPLIALPLLGVLSFGAVVALGTGVVLFPLAVMTIPIYGLGLLGLVPLATGLVFARAVAVLARRLGESVSRPLLALGVAAFAMGALAFGGGCGLLASRAQIRWTEAALAAGVETAAARRPIGRLRFLQVITPTCGRALERTWELARGEDRRRGLERLYEAVTGRPAGSRGTPTDVPRAGDPRPGSMTRRST